MAEDAIRQVGQAPASRSNTVGVRVSSDICQRFSVLQCGAQRRRLWVKTVTFLDPRKPVFWRHYFLKRNSVMYDISIRHFVLFCYSM